MLKNPQKNQNKTQRGALVLVLFKVPMTQCNTIQEVTVTEVADECIQDAKTMHNGL